MTIQKDLLDYILEQRNRGVSEEEIRKALFDAGWQAEDIEENMKSSGGSAIPSPMQSGQTTPGGSLAGVGELFSEARRLFAKNFKRAFLLMLYGVAIGVLVAVPAGILGWISLTKFPGLAGTLIAVFAYSLAGVWVIYTFLRAQLSFYLLLGSTEQVTSIRHIWNASQGKTRSFIWVAFLTNFVVAGGFLLFIIPGIIVALMVSFGLWVVALEGLRGRDALVRSRSYVVGRWGKIFGRIFVVALIGIAIGIGLEILYLVFGQDNLVINIIQVPISLLWSLFAFCYSFVLYNAAKVSAPPIDAAAEGKAKKKYTILAFLGPIMLLIIPILAATVLVSLNSARAKSRDAQRLAHVRQIQAALELYHNDYDSYPTQLEELSSTGYYLVIPTAPTPADGDCTDEQNQYRYERINNTSYELRFCIGDTVGGLQAGENQVEGQSNVESMLDENDLNSLFDLENKLPGTQVYYSEEFGIGFTYKSHYDLSQARITEIGNKIYFHSDSETPEQGQWIEVFSKSPNVNLAEAIRQQFLTNYDPSDCFVEVYQMSDQGLPDYVSADISYPPPSDPGDPGTANRENCPPVYSMTNGIQYFMANDNVPDKFIFVRVGQDAADGDGTPARPEEDFYGFTWSHSIRILE